MIKAFYPLLIFFFSVHWLIFSTPSRQSSLMPEVDFMIWLFLTSFIQNWYHFEDWTGVVTIRRRRFVIFFTRHQYALYPVSTYWSCAGREEGRNGMGWKSVSWWTNPIICPRATHVASEISATGECERDTALGVRQCLMDFKVTLSVCQVNAVSRFLGEWGCESLPTPQHPPPHAHAY